MRAPEFVSLAELLLPSAPEAALPSQEPEPQPVAAERVVDAPPDVASALLHHLQGGDSGPAPKTERHAPEKQDG